MTDCVRTELARVGTRDGKTELVRTFMCLVVHSVNTFSSYSPLDKVKLSFTRLKSIQSNAIKNMLTHMCTLLVLAFLNL